MRYLQCKYLLDNVGFDRGSTFTVSHSREAEIDLIIDAKPESVYRI